MANSSTYDADQLMLAFVAEARRSLGLKLVNSINIGFDMLGLFAFFTLTLATIKNKKLHSRCHLLIGLFAASSMGNKLLLLPSYVLLMNPWAGTATSPICALIQLLPCCGTFFIYTLILAISIDRMLCVYFPIWYAMKSDKAFYLPIVFGITALHPSYVVFALLSVGFGQPSKLSRCTMSEVVGTYFVTISYVDMSMVALTVLCYTAILWKLLIRKSSSKLGVHSANHQLQQSIIKSLLIIMSIQVGGSLAKFFSNTLVRQLTHGSSDAVLVAIVGAAINCLISLATSAEVPCLYFTSSDHRTALRKELCRLFRIKSHSQNSVTDIAFINGINLKRNSSLRRNERGPQPS